MHFPIALDAFGALGAPTPDDATVDETDAVLEAIRAAAESPGRHLIVPSLDPDLGDRCYRIARPFRVLVGEIATPGSNLAVTCSAGVQWVE